MAAAPPDPETRIDGPLLRLMLVMLLGGVMGILDTTIVNVGIDTLGAHFDAPLKTIEWVATGYLLALAATVPLAGWAAERFGGKTVWLVGLTVFLAGSALSALAWNAESLIAFRVLQGIGVGALEPTLLTMLARAAGPKRAGKMIGIVGAVVTLGPILGPVLGGVLLEHASWRWMFLINLPIGLIALALAYKEIPADPPREGDPSPLDARGIALLCPGFAAVVYGLSQAAGDSGFGAPQVIVALVAGVLLIAGYVAHALRARYPLIDVRLFAIRGFAGGIGAVFLTGILLFSLLFLIPLYYQLARDRGVMAAGLLLVPQGVGVWIGMPIAGQLFDKVGARALIPFGGVLAALGILGFSTADGGTNTGLLLAYSVVTGAGLGFVGAPAMSSVFGSVPPESIPSATAAVYLSNQIGGTFGIAVAALVLQRRSESHAVIASFQGTFAYLIAIAAVVGAVGLILRKPTSAAAPDLVPTEPQPAHQEV
ncbi:DHA2 family efflux MFS transporter permease subunit [Streptomyces sp. SID3343]|uniref:DHA2 family efflux MFS transporter permease subunit n=1 Tax=Streptomyces sp. SID3343 TaxID=2690260 RepID=UPI001369FF39|nr:DHA2 family efflux MFS transporter permease subunit [Streptomyces sp. SID3343]MYW01898.1 DHA2 family efflux MFS transporter permease subunit [Streptomyces sp. SID3343]